LNKLPKTLIIGIGNSGRQDDGLGWAFLDAIELKVKDSYDLEYRYQLQVEDAELIAHYEKVLFVDADMVQHPNGFSFKILEAKDVNSYSSHELNPESILTLTQKIYNAFPNCYTLGISGCDFHLAIGLSPTAQNNLEKSLHYFTSNFFENVATF
jgi:hydrogenase maturation protease